jgi:hypothetical protein
LCDRECRRRTARTSTGGRENFFWGRAGVLAASDDSRGTEGGSEVDRRAVAFAERRALFVGSFDALADVAIWANINDRRLRGGVGVMCECMPLPYPGKENLLTKTVPSLTRRLTVIRGSDSLSIARTMRRLPGQQRFGGLFFCLQLPSRLLGTRFTHHSASMGNVPCVAAVISIAPGSHVPSLECRNAS